MNVFEAKVDAAQIQEVWKTLDSDASKPEKKGKLVMDAAFFDPVPHVATYILPGLDALYAGTIKGSSASNFLIHSEPSSGKITIELASYYGNENLVLDTANIDKLVNLLQMAKEGKIEEDKPPLVERAIKKDGTTGDYVCIIDVQRATYKESLRSTKQYYYFTLFPIKSATIENIDQQKKQKINEEIKTIEQILEKIGETNENENENEDKKKAIIDFLNSNFDFFEAYRSYTTLASGISALGNEISGSQINIKSKEGSSKEFADSALKNISPEGNMKILTGYAFKLTQKTITLTYEELKQLYNMVKEFYKDIHPMPDPKSISASSKPSAKAKSPSQPASTHAAASDAEKTPKTVSIIRKAGDGDGKSGDAYNYRFTFYFNGSFMILPVYVYASDETV